MVFNVKIGNFTTFMIYIVFLLENNARSSLLNTEPLSQVSECAVRIIEQLPWAVFKTSIFAEKDNSTLMTEILRMINVPVVINSTELSKYKGTDIRVRSNLVIIIRYSHGTIDSLLGQTLWNGATKFILLGKEQYQLAESFKEFWMRRVVNVFALAENTHGVGLYSFSPYQYNNCSSTTPILLDTCINGTFIKEQFKIINEEGRIKNLNQCPVNTSAVPVKPAVIFCKGCNNSKDIDGIEVRIVKVIGEKLNITFTFSEPKDGLNWGAIHPPKGVVGEIYNRVSDFGIGLLSPVPDRYISLDVSNFIHGKECVTFAVPAGAGNDRLWWIKSITGALKPREWLYIILSLMVTAFVIHIGSKFTPMETFMYTTASVIGYSVKMPKNLRIKVVTMFLIFFSITITNIYKASLGREMTVPHKPAEINTFKQLLDSNLDLMGDSAMVKSMEEYRSEPIYTELANRYTITSGEVEIHLYKMLQDQKFAYLCEEINFLYLALIDPVIRGKIHIIDDCVRLYFPVILMQKNSPFTHTSNVIITRLFESGIIKHWRSLFVHPLENSPNRFKPVELKRSFGSLVILLGGLILATIAFFIELFLGYRKSRVPVKKLKL